ncbi:tripartite tricarboxylate transporter TctB family protein, partial [Pseudomonadota bacterium]
MSDRYLSIAFLFLAVLYSLAVSQIKITFINDPAGPRLFPFLVAIGLAISGVLLFLESAGTRQQNTAVESETIVPSGVGLIGV